MNALHSEPDSNFGSHQNAESQVALTTISTCDGRSSQLICEESDGVKARISRLSISPSSAGIRALVVWLAKRKSHSCLKGSKLEMDGLWITLIGSSHTVCNSTLRSSRLMSNPFNHSYNPKINEHFLIIKIKLNLSNK